jgi:hypothetical protein
VTVPFAGAQVGDYSIVDIDVAAGTEVTVTPEPADDSLGEPIRVTVG